MRVNLKTATSLEVVRLTSSNFQLLSTFSVLFVFIFANFYGATIEMSVSLSACASVHLSVCLTHAGTE